MFPTKSFTMIYMTTNENRINIRDPLRGLGKRNDSRKWNKMADADLEYIHILRPKRNADCKIKNSTVQNLPGHNPTVQNTFFNPIY